MKTQVNYDELLEVFKKRDDINAIELEDIEWIRNDGSVIDIPDFEIEEWKFTGLTNCFFAESVLPEILDDN